MEINGTIRIDVVYYWFTVDNNENVTAVNYAYDNPSGPWTPYPGNFASFKSGYPNHLLIPVPRGVV